MKNNVKALFKIELLSSFRRIYGFVFLALYWGALTYLFVRYNLSYTSVDISAVLSSMAVAAGLFIPILTLFGGADGESKKGYSTVSAMDCLPFGAFDKISAKFISSLTVLGIANIPLLIVPVINGQLSVADYTSSYAFLLVFLVFEIMLLSVSLYIETKKKNRLVAALINYTVFVIVFLAGSAKVLIPQSAVVSLVGAIIIGMLVGLITYLITRKTLISLVVGAVLAILPAPFFVISRDSFEGLLEELVGSLCVFRRLDPFTLGIFDIFALLVFAALAIGFFLLSVKTVTAKKMKKNNGVKITAACTVCVLMFSVVAPLVPILSVPIDATQNGKYSISSETNEFLGELDEEITLYFVAPTSAEDALHAFLKRYVATSKNLTLDVISPSADADVFEKYGIDTADFEPGSIILEGERKHVVLYPGDLFAYTNEKLGLRNLDSYTYAQYLYYFYAYDQASYEILQYETIAMFQGDSVLTTNIEYLVNDSMPTVFLLGGHEEAQISDNLMQYLEYFDVPDPYGFEVGELDLRDTDAVPENTKAIIVNCPQTDISDREYELLSSYLSSGGHITFLTDPTALELENLTALLADYGMSVQESTPVLNDGEAEISATFTYNHNVTAMLMQMSTSPVLLKNANSITLDKEAKDSLILAPLLTFASKGEDEETVTRNLAVAAETADGAKLVWITGAEEYDMASAEYSNSQMIICCAVWSDLTYTSELDPITPVVYSYPLMEIKTASATIWKGIFIVIPICAVAVGIITFAIRKKKDMINK